MPNNEYKLSREIIKRSVARTWNSAKTEWKLDSTIFSDVPRTCLCSHYPILEICTLVNRENDNRVVVGNCCVKKFMGLPSDDIFRGIKAIGQDICKSLNLPTLEYASDKGWITSRDMDFYTNTRRKRKLSDRQLKWRTD